MNAIKTLKIKLNDLNRNKLKNQNKRVRARQKTRQTRKNAAKTPFRPRCAGIHSKRASRSARFDSTPCRACRAAASSDPAGVDFHETVSAEIYG
jgi:hypothetical protein